MVDAPVSGSIITLQEEIVGDLGGRKETSKKVKPSARHRPKSHVGERLALVMRSART